MEAYCMKCQVMRAANNPNLIRFSNGRPAIRDICPQCGTVVFKIVKEGTKLDSQQVGQTEQFEMRKESTTNIQVAIGKEETLLHPKVKEGFEEFERSVRKLVTVLVDFVASSVFQMSRENTDVVAVKLRGEIKELQKAWRVEVQNDYKGLVTRAQFDALKQSLQGELAKSHSELAAAIEKTRRALPTKETAARVELVELKQSIQAELAKSHSELSELIVSIEEIRKALPSEDVITRHEFDEFRKAIRAVV